MVDAVISALLNQLALVTREHVEEKVKLVRGVDEELENLRGNLVAIKAVLTDAEMRQQKEEAVKLWLDELTDVSYDMDTVLDEWSTAILKSEFDQRENKADKPTKLKVRFSILFSFCHSTPVIVHRLDIAEKIQSLNEKLERIALRKNMFCFKETSGDPLYLKRPDHTTSFLDVPVVYGQNDKLELLISRLRLSQRGQEDSYPIFIPIVGMGGIGKTTLARNAYNDVQVKTIFERNMIWVCVSDPFHVPSIAKEIIEQLTNKTSTATGLESLMKEFRDSIKGKKFLLVLDDVWTTDYSKWLLLEQVLRLGTLGSSVVVTTRNEKVAKMMGDTHKICVNKLTDEESWLLLRQIALSNRTVQAREEFDTIGGEIARKCDGLPLAVKTLGSLLRVKDIEDWHEMLTSEIWQIKNVEVELFNPLLFSYYDLTSVERRCFLYCAIFPKDHEFERDDLIKQWVAQGYFKSRNDDQYEFEQTGRVCFQNLAERSFFQDFIHDDNHFTIKCKMHDIVHDFAQYLTKNEYSVKSVFTAGKRVDLDTRHLNLVNISVSPTFSSLKKKNLLTLMVTCDSTFTRESKFPHEILSLRFLKTLILKGKSMEFPPNIGDLIHLRYFSFYSSYKISVPPSIGNLLNLQTLKFLGQIEKLPEDIGKLINLRHLQLSYNCICPKSIANLTSLQTLENVYLPSTVLKNNNTACLQDIRSLNNLRRLGLVGLGSEEDKEMAKEAELGSKTKLVHLNLSFERVFQQNMETQQIVLEALRPHISLKTLKIVNYCGRSISPSWMMWLNNLRSLYLYNFHYLEILPPLGKLPCLESLEIYCFDSLVKMGPEILGVETCNNTSREASFPKLKRLRISGAGSFKEWGGVAGWTPNGPLQIMPSLEFLHLFDCDKLEMLPDFLESTPLKNLEIHFCDILVKSCNRDTGEDWPKIRHVPNIIIK